MKKFIGVWCFIVLAVVAGIIGLGYAESIYTDTLVSAGAIEDSGTSTYVVGPDLTNYNANGHFSLQVTTAGAGSVVQITYQMSNDGTTFVTPSSANDIATSHSVGSDLYQFYPEFGKFMKILVTETAGNPVTSITMVIGIGGD